MWHGGLLGKIVSDSYFMWLATKTFIESQKSTDKRKEKGPVELPSLLQRWLVFDGDLDPMWTEGIKTMMDDEQRLSLGNGEGILLKGQFFPSRKIFKLIINVTHITNSFMFNQVVNFYK